MNDKFSSETEIKNYIEKLKDHLINKENYSELKELLSDHADNLFDSIFIKKDGLTINLCTIFYIRNTDVKIIKKRIDNYEKYLIEAINNDTINKQRETIRGIIVLVFPSTHSIILDSVLSEIEVKDLKSRLHLLPVLVFLKDRKIYPPVKSFTYYPDYPPGRLFLEERLPKDIPHNKKEEILNTESIEEKEKLQIEELKKMIKFKVSMNEKTPYITWTLLTINILIWILMEDIGGSQNINVMIAFGASERIAIWQGEYWRLFSAIFIHIGLFHLMGNCLFLYFCGPLLEFIYGREKFLIIYILSGLMGNILSLIGMTSGIGISAGASGALLGILGALISFTIIERKKLPFSLYRSLVINLFLIVFLNIMISLIFPNIDILAHIGGFLAGLCLGYILENELYLIEKTRNPGYKILPTALAFIFLIIFTGLFLKASRAPEDFPYYMGIKYLNDEKYEKAEKEFKKALEIKPEKFEIYLNLAISYLGQYKIKEAREELQKALKREPENILLNYLMGNAYYQQGNIEKALFYYQKTIELNKKFAPAYESLGDIYRIQKKWEPAIENSKKAIDLNSSLPSARSTLGMIYLYQQQIEEAKKQFDIAVKISSNTDVNALIGIIGIHIYRGEFDKALKKVEDIKKIKNGIYLAYIIESDIYRTMGEYDEAINQARVARELQPLSYYSHLYLGKAYLSSDRLEEALSCIQKSIELNYSDPSTYGLMALIYWRLNRLEEALKQTPPHSEESLYNIFLANCYYYNTNLDIAEREIDKALQINPSLTEAYLLKAWIFYNRGEVEKADKTIQSALDIDPYDDRLTYFEGYLLLQKGETEEAEKKFNRLRDMSSPLTCCGKAWIFYINKKWDKAREQALLSLKSYEKDPEGHLILGMIAEAKGDIEEAINKYNTVLKYDPNQRDAKERLKKLK